MTDADREALLERAISHLKHHLAALRGEWRDCSSIGRRQMAFDALEKALDVKILPASHYADLVFLCRIANGELTGEDLLRRLVRTYDRGGEGLLHIIEDARRLLNKPSVPPI